MAGNMKSTCWVGFHFNPMSGKIKEVGFVFLGIKKIKTDTKQSNMSDSHSHDTLPSYQTAPLLRDGF